MPNSIVPKNDYIKYLHFGFQKLCFCGN